MLKKNIGEESEKESMQTASPLVMFGNISFASLCVLKVDKIPRQKFHVVYYVVKLRKTTT